MACACEHKKRLPNPLPAPASALLWAAAAASIAGGIYLLAKAAHKTVVTPDPLPNFTPDPNTTIVV